MMNPFGPSGTPLEKFTQTGNLSYLYESTPFDTAIITTYFIVLAILALYGVHRYQMVYLYYKYKKNLPKPLGRLEQRPSVTVQLPIYNEMYVAERLIESVCALNYPRQLLEIQVLDDSTDETCRVASSCVQRWAARGFDIHYIHRPNRTGFKAGALENGLKTARGEYVAIFDADFMPAPETILETLDYFSDPKIGMVQVRWGHINRDYSFLTRVQAILLDGHFVIEHTARNRSGRFFNFNGTAGVWRRTAIESAGGWEHDTLTEDLDLSYRAQLRGWKFIFLQQIVSPAEIPVEMNSFKSQQNRWAKGSMQTCKKLLPTILRSDLHPLVKLEAFFHLSANVTYPLMVLLSILLFPALIVRYHQGWFQMALIDLPLFLMSSLSVSSFYVASQKEIYPDWKTRLKYLPFLMSVGIGLAVSNAKAVLEAVFGIQTKFHRTPKYSVRNNSADDWKQKKYHARIGVLPFVEVALGLYFTAMIYYCFDAELYGPIPFLGLFLVGYYYTGLTSLLQTFKLRTQAQEALALSNVKPGAPAA